MNKKQVTLQEKANTIAGYKHYVEMRSGLTNSTYNYVFNDVYLLSIIGENENWRNLFIPIGTHLICRRIPKNFKPDYVINNDPTPFLELGKTYTIKRSIVGESFSWYELEELPEHRVHLSWFEIAPEDRITPKQALKLYSGNIDEEYKRVDDYLQREERRRQREEEMKPKELFVFNDLRFDNFNIGYTDDDDMYGNIMLIDLCEECAKKCNLPEKYRSKEPYNGEPFEIYCGIEDCCEKAVYGYAIPIEEGKKIIERKK